MKTIIRLFSILTMSISLSLAIEWFKSGDYFITSAMVSVFILNIIEYSRYHWKCKLSYDEVEDE